MNTLVLETSEHGDYPVDVYQKLSGDRILFLTNNLSDELTSDIVATLLLKDAEDSEKKITIFINSMGGDIRNAFMIYDMMQMIDAPIETVCIGNAADEAALILAAGEPGLRFATKNSVVTIGQLVHNFTNYSNLTDAKKSLDLSMQDNKRMISILATCSGKTYKQVMEDFDRKVFMTASQAVKYKLIDKVIKVNK